MVTSCCIHSTVTCMYVHAQRNGSSDNAKRLQLHAAGRIHLLAPAGPCWPLPALGSCFHVPPESFAPSGSGLPLSRQPTCYQYIIHILSPPPNATSRIQKTPRLPRHYHSVTEPPIFHLPLTACHVPRYPSPHPSVAPPHTPPPTLHPHVPRAQVPAVRRRVIPCGGTAAAARCGVLLHAPHPARGAQEQGPGTGGGARDAQVLRELLRGPGTTGYGSLRHGHGKG